MKIAIVLNINIVSREKKQISQRNRKNESRKFQWRKVDFTWFSKKKVTDKKIN